MNSNIRSIEWAVMLGRPEVRIAIIGGLAISLFVLWLAGIASALIVLVPGLLVSALLAFLIKRWVWRPQWFAKHRQFVKTAKRGNVDLLFLGDCITEGWLDKGVADLWEQHFAPLRAANFGLAGDLTHQVLWRLRDGELKGIRPKVIVLMIGSNNISMKETPQATSESIAEILSEIHAMTPETKILLLGILPRGRDGNPWREKIKQANTLISKFNDGQRVFFIDIAPSFMDGNQNISKDIMYDHLHLTRKGYEIWGEVIKGQIVSLMR